MNTIRDSLLFENSYFTHIRYGYSANNEVPLNFGMYK